MARKDLIKSSKEVNQVIAGLANISENVGETRLLAMTSLILADKLNELNITTINGNSFQNNHVHMMLKRYHQRQFRLNLMKTEYEEEWSKMEIKYEKTFSLPHSRT